MTLHSNQISETAIGALPPLEFSELLAAFNRPCVASRPAGWPWHVDGENADSETRAAQLADLASRKVDYEQREARAKKSAAAYRKHINRNTKKSGPLNAVTLALREAAYRRFILADHPAQCEICNGAHGDDAIVSAHRAYIEALAGKRAARESEIKAARDAYYAGGFRMVIDGIPIRMAAHVKNWKPGNRAALCQGFDPFGLTLAPHTKGKHAMLLSEYDGGARRRSFHIEGKSLGAWEGAPPDESHKERLRQAGYCIMHWPGDGDILFREGRWISGYAEGDYSKSAQDRARGIRRLAFGSDLFMSARIARRVAASGRGEK